MSRNSKFGLLYHVEPLVIVLTFHSEIKLWANSSLNFDVEDIFDSANNRMLSLVFHTGTVVLLSCS